jgi:hypothetical protein
MQRDLRIDLLRGIGILMIAVDHLAALLQAAHPAGFVNPFVTWTRIGWSSAAEFFVFFSGFVVGLVYVKTFESRGALLLQARAVHRAWQIYVANILALIAVILAMPLAGGAAEAMAQVTRIAALNDAASWYAFLTLRDAPLYFEILHLYVLLLLFAPAIVICARFNAAATAVASLLLWAWVQATADPSQWTFNPAAWQLLFVLGAVCSVAGLVDKARLWLSSRRLLAFTTTLLVLAFVVKAAGKGQWSLPLLGAFELAGTDKSELAPLRLAHFLVSIVFVFQVVPGNAVVSGSRLLRTVASVGRSSLECFCASTVLAYAFTAVLLRTGVFGPLPLLASGVVLVLLLCAWAPMVDWIKSEPWRRSVSAIGETKPQRDERQAARARADNFSSMPPPAARVDFQKIR